MQKILASGTSLAKPEFEKNTGRIRCPHCGETRLLSIHAEYSRHRHYSKSLESIRRYRCKNKRCKVKTFSVLPFPFLPVIRHTIFRLARIVDAAARKCSIYAMEKTEKLDRGVIRRAIATGRKVLGWIKKEAPAATWGPLPCSSPERQWGAFTRSLSAFIFPSPP